MKGRPQNNETEPLQPMAVHEAFSSFLELLETNPDAIATALQASKRRKKALPALLTTLVKMQSNDIPTWPDLKKLMMIIVESAKPGLNYADQEADICRKWLADSCIRMGVNPETCRSQSNLAKQCIAEYRYLVSSVFTMMSQEDQLKEYSESTGTLSEQELVHCAINGDPHHAYNSKERVLIMRYRVERKWPLNHENDSLHAVVPKSAQKEDSPEPSDFPDDDDDD